MSLKRNNEKEFFLKILGKKLICINSCMSSRLNFPLKLLCFLLPCWEKSFCTKNFLLSADFSHFQLSSQYRKMFNAENCPNTRPATININRTAASRQNQEEGNIHSKIFTAQLCHKLRQKRWWKKNLNFNVCFHQGTADASTFTFRWFFFRSHDHKNSRFIVFCFPLDYSNFRSHIKPSTGMKNSALTIL